MIKSFMRTVRTWRKQVQAFLLASCIGAAVLAPCASMAQNLGTTPATGQAVQGQTAAQPEGAFLNAVNWLCNVICPVGAGIAVVATILQWRSGRSWLPSAMTAGGLICVSGILRLIEYFIAQGQAIGWSHTRAALRSCGITCTKVRSCTSRDGWQLVHGAIKRAARRSIAPKS
jgi:hypothetical protein